jgi:DNA-directed RNA polymerase
MKLFKRQTGIYVPRLVDHRGRAYPVPPLMNPQSDHTGRALLEFAHGKPLGERGASWLAIHLANCYWKKKKVAFKNRLAWVRENKGEILDFAANPLRMHRFWAEADQPCRRPSPGLCINCLNVFTRRRVSSCSSLS